MAKKNLTPEEIEDQAYEGAIEAQDKALADLDKWSDKELNKHYAEFDKREKVIYKAHETDTKALSKRFKKSNKGK